MKIFRRFLFALLPVLIFTVAPPSFAATVPDDGVLNFSVMRKGDKIGSHRMVFTHSNDKTSVNITTRIKVKVLFVTAYHFEHNSRETWQGDQMTSLWSKTNDDGRKHQMNVTKNAPDLAIDADGKFSSAKANIIPASLWNKAVVEQNILLNTLDGSQMKVTTTNLGFETITVKGQHVKAEHFKVQGDLERELWYTPLGLLVKFQLTGSDGSNVQYILE